MSTNKQSNRMFRAHYTMSQRQGAILVLFCVLLPIILLIAGFGLYIAKAQLLRSELRTATDFAARAGAKRLSLDQSQSSAIAAAIDTASRNNVSGNGLALDASDITLGESRQLGGRLSRFEFSPGGNQLNSVRVDGNIAANDPVIGLFGRLAGIPVQDYRLPATATNLDRDICVVIDRSGSMTQPVNSTNNGTLEPCGPLASDTRFAALSRAVDAFIDELNATPQDELICLASYSSPVNIRCRCCPGGGQPCSQTSTRCRGATSHFITFPQASIHSNLSSNAAALRGPIDGMMQQGIGGSTAIGSGLAAGLQAVKGPGARPFAFPTVVLMTDGNHNRGTSPDVIAQQAATDGIVVHTITFSRGANQSLMRTVAQITGGTHRHADNERDLTEAFREIARSLPVMLTN